LLTENRLYNLVHTGLEKLGLKPHLLSEELICSLFGITERYADRVPPKLLRPASNWREAADWA
jgi:UDP-sulfoquinovose synthase